MLKHLSALAIVVLIGFAGRSAFGQCCGDCNGDGQVTVNELVAAVTRALQVCEDDGICSASTCPAQLAECRQGLADCEAEPAGHGLLASGQTTSYGSGSDGDVQTGAPLSYTDNGDGTITDNNTGLMWEKKDDSGGVHDVDNRYTWGTPSEPFTMDGTMVTEFLAVLNTPPCFAGHCDWRIPNVRELQSIVDYQIPAPGPTVNPAFHNPSGCTGCTDLKLASCTCTAINPLSHHWTSTTIQAGPASAWAVIFFNGAVVPLDPTKSSRLAVRAVRGGSRG